MSNKNLSELLRDPEKGVGRATNVVSRLWRTILRDNGVNHSQLNTLIHEHIRKDEKSAALSHKRKSQEKGNLIKELENDKMTFKNLMKGLRVLNPLQVDFTITIKWNRYTTSTHTVQVDMKNSSPTTDGSDESDDK